MIKSFFQKYSALLFLSSVYALTAPSDCDALQVSNLSSVERLTPGEKKQVKLTLFNDRSVAERVDFKVVDYSCNSDGEHFFEEEPSSDRSIKYPRSSVNWVHLGQERVMLDPGETREVYYVIETPNDPTLKGSYWSVLLIEPEEQSPSNQQNDEGLQLKVKIRYAHHTVVTLGEAAPKLKIVKKEIKEIEDHRFLCLHVLNEGNLFFNPALTLKLYDNEGKLQKTLGPQTERLYPGNSQSFLLDLQEPPESPIAEKYTGFLLFDGNDNFLFGDKFTYP